MLRYLFTFLLLTTQTFGQAPAPDSSFVTLARADALARYEKPIRRQAHVYDGHEYITHDHRIKIHPYYRVDSLQTGTVDYKGVAYKEVPMLYDIVRDQLAIQPPEGGYRLTLRNEYLSAFTIGSYRFARIVGDSAVGVPTGFYEVLHEGRVKALARRVKTIHEDISQGFYKADYLLKDRFFLVKDGAYHEIKTKRSLLGLFPEQSRTLRKHMRQQGLRFNNDEREKALTKTMQFYDTLR